MRRCRGWKMKLLLSQFFFVYFVGTPIRNIAFHLQHLQLGLPIMEIKVWGLLGGPWDLLATYTCRLIIVLIIPLNGPVEATQVISRVIGPVTSSY